MVRVQTSKSLNHPTHRLNSQCVSSSLTLQPFPWFLSPCSCIIILLNTFKPSSFNYPQTQLRIPGTAGLLELFSPCSLPVRILSFRRISSIDIFGTNTQSRSLHFRLLGFSSLPLTTSREEIPYGSNSVDENYKNPTLDSPLNKY